MIRNKIKKKYPNASAAENCFFCLLDKKGINIV
jgi:hypothetical protein